jgi:ribosomal-protein-alanine N-acetyltransferase
MMKMREASLKDIPQLVEIENECFSIPWSANSFEDTICLDNTLLLVAELEQEQKIVGYCGMYQTLDEGEITNVAVLQPYRRQGIADKIMGELKKESRKREITCLYLDVRMGNEAAIALYEKHGFVKDGMRKGFYSKPKEDALLMKCEFAKAE